MTSSLDTLDLDDLPHWEAIPDDLPTASRQLKGALRARIERQSGRSITDVVAEMEAIIRVELNEVRAIVDDGGCAWPVLDYADVAVGAVSDDDIALLKRRGCAIIRNTFDRSTAAGWDAEVVDYVDRNGFFESYRGPGDDFFGSVDSKPEIYPIYWARPQMEARQSPRMATVQAFLNSLWTSRSAGQTWFDPSRNLVYPDRIRRRPPGATSSGLGTHLDPGTLDMWMSHGYQGWARHLWNGDPASFDPWDASYRTLATHYPGSTMCSAFRTFQGWTALSDMDHDQGVLHTVPIAKAIGYLMLRPLLDDVADDEWCGVQVSRAFPATKQWHAWLIETRAGIPDVQMGDTAWWHCDMIHSVAPVENQRGWGNVMYIPAAPWCPPNEAYAAKVAEALRTGSSPYDFPEEHYERTWPDRFTIDDLNDIGRAGLGLPPVGDAAQTSAARV